MACALENEYVHLSLEDFATVAVKREEAEVAVLEETEPVALDDIIYTRNGNCRWSRRAAAPAAERSC